MADFDPYGLGSNWGGFSLNSGMPASSPLNSPDWGGFFDPGYDYGGMGSLSGSGGGGTGVGTNWWDETDWSNVGNMAMNAAGMFGGGGNAPTPEGYDWNTWQGGYGPSKGNLNPYTDPLYQNINNLWAQQGVMGGMNAFNNQAMPMLSKLSQQETGYLKNQLGAQATLKTGADLENLGANFGNGMYSGAFAQGAADTAANNYLQAGLAGEQARLGLLGNWSQQAMGDLNNLWGAQTNWMMNAANPELVAPVMTPRYAQKKGPSFGGFMQGALGGAGAGAALGPWGALGGAIIGGIGGLFT